MLTRWPLLVLVTVATLLSASMLLVSAPASALQDDISFTQDYDSVTIKTDNSTVEISKAFPAAFIRPANDTTGYGYGFMTSCFVGYNESDVLENPLAEGAYHASLTNASWTMIGPTESSDDAVGNAVTVAFRATVDMSYRQSGGGQGSGGSGSAGAVIIEDWAVVQFTFQVSTKSHFSVYPGFSDQNILVNGSTEVKFDVGITLSKTINADSLAMDMGLAKVHSSNLSAPADTQGYKLLGYQSDGITTSYPSVNETDGTAPIIHRFQYRNAHEQMFAFVEENVTKGYFSWANKVMLNWSGGSNTLEDTRTYYGTDGECLRIYVSSPIGLETTAITHDPSIGIFEAPGGGGGVIIIPDDGGIFGSSAMSVAAGVVIGGAIIGGSVGVMWVTSRRGEDDPADTLSLEKNRYYRRRR